MLLQFYAGLYLLTCQICLYTLVCSYLMYSPQGTMYESCISTVEGSEHLNNTIKSFWIEGDFLHPTPSE